MPRRPLLVVVLLLAACSKTEAPTAAEAPSSSGGNTSAAPAVAESAKPATPSAPIVPILASASSAPVECGTKPLPDCPLQAWMKANVNPPVMAKDAPALAAALDKIVGFAPPGYTNWASITKDGAAAALSGDLDAAKASCRSCHDQYKQKYKHEFRARKL